MTSAYRNTDIHENYTSFSQFNKIQNSPINAVFDLYRKYTTTF